MITFVDIEEARERIKEHIYLSPFPYSETISRMSGNRVFFKLENLQMTGSFKERGALNRLLTLTPDEAQRGVIAASAGNHGMAMAFHSRRLNIAATIVMPLFAPLIKVTRVRQYGATSVLSGNDYDAALAEALRLSEERKPWSRPRLPSWIRSSVFVHARRYSIAIFTTRRRFESTSRRAASTSPCSRQSSAS